MFAYLLLYIKTTEIFEKYGNLKHKCRNHKLWVRRYYISKVGLYEKTAIKCIREKERGDISLDQLSIKEYVNQFSNEGSEHEKR